MKLISDLGNTHSLKILIAAKESGQHVDFKVVQSKEKVVPYLQQNHVPVLEVEPEQFIFSSNAAACLLFSKAKSACSDVSLVDTWSEWESSQLQPDLHVLLVSVLGSAKLDTTRQEVVQEHLKTLQAALQSIKYLAGPSLSAADVIVWAAVYPVFCGESPVKSLSGQFGGIQSWFAELGQRSSFRTAVETIFPKNSAQLLKTSLLAQPVPLLPSSGSKSNQKTEAVDGGKEENAFVSEGSEKALTQDEIAAATEAWINGLKSVPTPRQRIHPILPQENDRNVLVTSALPYVNNVPHLGNIIGCVLSADVYARYCRLRGYNTLYICGTDEYGTATETKAVEEGLTPQEICDKYNKLHTEIYKWFNIDFDYFGRTTTEEQTKIAQDIFWKLHHQGYILKDSVDQLQCKKCDRFLADRFVEGTCPLCGYEDARGDQCDKCGKLINAVELREPKCKLCKSTPVVKTSRHLFLDLPQLEGKLSEYLDKQFQTGIWTSNCKVITKSWIRDGLKPRCISRDLKWGTPVPMEEYTDKVFYVWYDAPIGYISITANYTDHWEQWWKNPQKVQLYQFMAKDNVPFHSVIFPCTLLGTDINWTVVNHLSSTEYLNYEDGKFSKSRGVGVFGNNAKDTGIPADIWRFYLLYIRPESQDTTFSWEDFVTKNNSELLNNLGNFINRALMFINNSFKGTVAALDLTDEDKELLALITRELQRYTANLEKIRLRDGIRNILNISRLGNQYMQSSKPWVLVKGSAEEKARAGTVTGLAANIACLLSVMVQPYMPGVSKMIQTQLNAPTSCNVLTDTFVCYLQQGHKIGKPSPLFQKIEPARAGALKKQFAGTQVDRQLIEKANSQKTAVGVSNGPVQPASPEVIEKLAADVANQGEVVRKLKADKAEKSKIDEAVASLLALKRQLAIAQGEDPNAPPPGGAGGKKKKGKKSNQV